MTVAHTRPALHVKSLGSALRALRENGMRASAARRLVIEALLAADEPVSAERIAGGLDGAVPRSDLASVYRNLETLGTLGLVRHLHLGHGPGLYELADGDREFLVCEGCDAIRAVDPGELDDVRALLRERFGFRAGFAHLPIAGLCEECA
jgi:Fur family transcriptional regulator, ferric uptake regulator